MPGERRRSMISLLGNNLFVCNGFDFFTLVRRGGCGEPTSVFILTEEELRELIEFAMRVMPDGLGGPGAASGGPEDGGLDDGPSRVL